MNVEINLNRLT